MKKLFALNLNKRSMAEINGYQVCREEFSKIYEAAEQGAAKNCHQFKDVRGRKVS